MPCANPHYPRTHYDPNVPLPAGTHSKRTLKERYDSKHCFRLDDILHAGLDYSLLENTDGPNTTKTHNVRDKRQLAKQIAWEFLTTMVDGLIDTGDHYLLPTRSFCLLRIVAAPDSVSQRRLAKGRYQMVDALRADFKTYELQFNYKRPNNPKIYKRFCRLDLPRYYRLCQLVNQGKVAYDLN